ncbi:MAG: hypothetical protein ABIR25_02205, partial [Sphingomicrobium sp.]
AFGKRLPALRAASLRANAALLRDQRQFGAAFLAILRSLRLEPLDQGSWRTLAYILRFWRA